MPFRIYRRLLRIRVVSLRLLRRTDTVEGDGRIPGSAFLEKLLYLNDSSLLLTVETAGKKVGKFRHSLRLRIANASDVEDSHDLWLPQRQPERVDASNDALELDESVATTSSSIDLTNVVDGGTTKSSSRRYMEFPLAARDSGMEILHVRLHARNRIVGEFAIRERNLRTGYRVATLRTRGPGGSVVGELLCRFEIQDLASEEWSVKWPSTPSSRKRARHVMNSIRNRSGDEPSPSTPSSTTRVSDDESERREGFRAITTTSPLLLPKST